MRIFTFLVIFVSFTMLLSGAEESELDTATAVDWIIKDRKPEFKRTQTCWQEMHCKRVNLSVESYFITREDRLVVFHWGESKEYYHYTEPRKIIRAKLLLKFKNMVSTTCDYYTYKDCLGQ